jgi:phospholipid-transporting ATPase
MMNSMKPKAKRSKLQKSTNIYILGTMLVQFLLALISCLIGSIWQYTAGGEFWYIYPYDGNTTSTLAHTTVINFFIWYVVLMNFVPVSLLLTLEMINFVQAYFITVDVNMVDITKKGLAASVQSSNLNEELGMVKYIFSDKTGTLTQNVMEFKRFSVGKYEYGREENSQCEYPPGVTNVNFDDPRFDDHINNESHSNRKRLLSFMEALGLCHTVIPENKKDKDGTEYVAYNASSPDELALVNGARHMGFFFKERDEDGNMVC